MKWELNPNSDPMKTWSQWWTESKEGASVPPETVSVATVGKEGRPSIRTVYFRGIRDGGFSFFTHYESRKGRELTENPVASMLFHWQHQERQVRVEGKVIRVSPQESDAYFRARAHDSQISASVSKQSQPLADYSQFVQEIEAFEKKLGPSGVTRPENWGGFAIIPDRIEFWQAGEFRRHRRIEFSKQSDGTWKGTWLYP